MTRIVLICVGLVVLAGCGGGTNSSTLPVVASTNVYGDIARQIGGSHVDVTSILTDPNADPHLFEPGTANGLAVAHARVAIQNGLGYDAFMSRLESAAPSSDRTVVTISDVLGVHGHDANPHLWYDVPALPKIATAIEQALAGADAAHASDYRTGLRTFIAALAPLQATVVQIRAAHAGAPVAYTEPVPGYLVEAAGLRNLSLSSFTLPIEEGSEPSARAVSAMTALATGHRIKALFYNSQAVSPITQRVRAAAKAAGVPVIGVSETVPAGLTFQAWQLKQARELQQALSG
ncbi:MAG TPA: zinc ABC transporter substrate-binding protein [Gaiellaceae bacterium]|jgi:zinc/manganese transport system substrate-binding protein|nr:zinc ABC transporter substrate-binding protein [Gaiellaceae bacterium]